VGPGASIAHGPLFLPLRILAMDVRMYNVGPPQVAYIA